MDANTVNNAAAIELLNLATVVNSYPVQLLDKVAKIELEAGQYLVRKIEKGTGKASKGAIIAALSPEFATAALENDTVFSGYIGWLQGIAGELCKARIDAGATTLVPDDYRLEAIVEWLQDQEAAAGRVSKDRLFAWFDSTAAAPLKSAFKAKLGDSISDDKLAQVLASYKTAFGLLAKREIALETAVQDNLTKALDLVVAANGGQKTALVQYCQKKLDSSAVKAADMLAL